MSKKPSVCIINRNYPPVKGATGYHAHQLAQYLISQDIEVHVVTTAQKKDQIQGKNIHHVTPFYNGSAKKIRLLSSYLEASRLVTKALHLNVDFYIVMTDPPLLNYIAAKRMKVTQCIIWTMDLYPDGFVANGLVTQQNRLFEQYQKQLRKNPPLLMITLGKRQKGFLKENYYPSTPSIDWPIGLRIEGEGAKDVDIPEESPEWAHEDSIVLGYVGNIGEAHNPDVLRWIAEALDPEQHKLVLSCEGTHKKMIEDTLGALDNVHIVSHIPEAFMSKIDVHIVILRSDWTNICVPSKAVSAIQYRGTVLFCGAAESDAWNTVKTCGWKVESEEEILVWIASLSPQKVIERKQHTTILYNQLKSKLHEGWKELSTFLKKEH
ncbi:MAG: glycosyltransferase involved in cell wall biosynthesis [Saprospiraceae bacterium]